MLFTLNMFVFCCAGAFRCFEIFECCLHNLACAPSVPQVSLGSARIVPKSSTQERRGPLRSQASLKVNERPRCEDIIRHHPDIIRHPTFEDKSYQILFIPSPWKRMWKCWPYWCWLVLTSSKQAVDILSDLFVLQLYLILHSRRSRKMCNGILKPSVWNVWCVHWRVGLVLLAPRPKIPVRSFSGMPVSSGS